MGTVGQFTQYYVVSIIIPALINLGVLLFSVRSFNSCYSYEKYSAGEWTIIIIAASIITLFVGMSLERVIYKFIHSKSLPNKRKMQYREFSSWRHSILHLSNLDKVDLAHRIFYTEQTVAKYYCVNNIIIGIGLITIFLFCFQYFVAYPNLSFVVLCLFGLFILFTGCAIYPMRIWLAEISELLNV